MRNKKAQIRKEFFQKLNSQAREEVLRKSRIIKDKLFSLPEFKKAGFVMFYASKAEEVNTDEMIDEALEMGKRVALPLCAGPRRLVPKEITNRQKDTRPGIYGIYEPFEHLRDAELEKIDLIIVPGVAFDDAKTRLGRGKGYYDAFLKALPRNKISIGLAFDFQVVKSLPKDSHDIPVSRVITN